MNFDLTKKAEAFTFELTKRGVTKAPIMRVCGALDVSGSMSDEIADGSLQSAMDQLGGITIVFDDNGEIDMWAFDHGASRIKTWTPDDYKTYVRQNIRVGGATNYSPFMTQILDEMFSGTPTIKVPRQVESKGIFGFGKKIETVYDEVADPNAKHEPVLVLAITDGEPSGSDWDRIQAVLRRAAQLPVFFAFVGMSNQSVQFPTLERMARENQNVGFVKMKFKRPDQELYEQIVTDKLVAFLKRF